MTRRRCAIAFYSAGLVGCVARATDLFGSGVVGTLAVLVMAAAVALGETAQ